MRQVFTIILTCLMLLHGSLVYAIDVPHSGDDLPAKSDAEIETLTSYDYCTPQIFCMLQVVYLDRNYEPFWFRGDRLSHRGNQLIMAFYDAEKHGIDPVKFFDIEALEEEIKSDYISENDVTLLDIHLTYLLYRYLEELMPASHKIYKEDFEKYLASNKLLKNLKEINSADEEYAALQDLLEETVLDVDKNREAVLPFEKISFQKKYLREGMQDQNVPILRARLIDYIDSNSAEGFGEGLYVYDAALVAAVKKYQSEHGEQSDGVVGPSTLALLNRSDSDYKDQISANLRRLRKQDAAQRNEKRIEVNIPEFMLRAYEKGADEPSFDMKVVVGRPQRQTLRFTSEIRGMRFNPTWTVPNTIKHKDFLPKLREDPLYLESQNIRILDGWDSDAQEVDPLTIDWNEVSVNQMKAMRIWQPAGSGNPLGQIRVLMDNPYDIYLHDTNSRRYFQKSQRALSSGCVRVEDPELITSFIMSNKEGWSEDDTQAILSRGKTRDILLDDVIPVYLDYRTVWRSPEGGSHVFGHDVYGLDSTELHAINDLSVSIRQEANTIRKLFIDLLNNSVINAENNKKVPHTS